jgi:predicted  nucleic acid-binding Zn-ribbon protein
MIKKEVRKMCKQAVVLDTIKKTKGKGGMTSAQIKLAEAQSEDYADMKRELQGLKTDVNDVKKEVADVKVQLAGIKGNIDILLENSKIKSKLIDNKYFWFFLIIIVCLFAGVTHIKEIAMLFGG